MQNELMSILHQSELNKVVQQKLMQHYPAIGTLEEGEKLPDYIIANMNHVSDEIILMTQTLNKIFIEKNITANSSEAYVKFLCDLLAEYLLVPSYEDIGSLSKPEIEAIVISQVETTPMDYMRAAMIQNAYMNQAHDAALTVEQIKTQYKEIDDSTIKDAYRTLLMKQINVSNQTPQ